MSNKPKLKKPFTQDAIDRVRMRVMTAMLASGAVHNKQHHYEGKVWHLWFPEARAGKYELREGNPPPDDRRDRPAHLLRKKLVIDMRDIPAEVWDEVAVRLAEHTRGKTKLVETPVDAVRNKGVIVDKNGLPYEG